MLNQDGKTAINWIRFFFFQNQLISSVVVVILFPKHRQFASWNERRHTPEDVSALPVCSILIDSFWFLSDPVWYERRLGFSRSNFKKNTNFDLESHFWHYGAA